MFMGDVLRPIRNGFRWRLAAASTAITRWVEVAQPSPSHPSSDVCTFLCRRTRARARPQGSPAAGSHKTAPGTAIP